MITKEQLGQLFDEVADATPLYTTFMSRTKFIEIVYDIHQKAYLNGYTNGYHSACDELQDVNYKHLNNAREI